MKLPYLVDKHTNTMTARSGRDVDTVMMQLEVLSWDLPGGLQETTNISSLTSWYVNLRLCPGLPEYEGKLLQL